MSNGSALPITSLYVHVPFCAHKCEYCAFYSEAANGQVVNRYVAALVRELELTAADLQPRTIFFGGGTPSLLNLKQWETVLGTMERLGLLGAEEWTVECNPATVSLDKARLLRRFGVNRVSMGVQSLDAGLLERLGRVHSREMVFKSYDILRTAGFDNVNLDLMFAIPGQTLDMWRQTLAEAAALNSEHLSCYEVIYEQDTPLFAQLQAGQFAVDEDLAGAMYEELLETAAAHGFQQYEVANFARQISSADCGVAPSAEGARPRAQQPDSSFAGHGNNGATFPSDPCTAAPGDGHPPLIPNRACQHNVNYWRGGSYYGLGPSAAGYVRGRRTRNFSNTQLYCEQLEKGRRPVESTEELAPLARAGETAAFGLRMNAGWPFETFRQIAGYDLPTEWSAEIERLVQLDYARLEEDRFHLTRQGMRYADWAAELFLR